MKLTDQHVPDTHLSLIGSSPDRVGSLLYEG